MATCATLRKLPLITDSFYVRSQVARAHKYSLSSIYEVSDHHPGPQEQKSKWRRVERPLNKGPEIFCKVKQDKGCLYTP